MRLRGLHAGLKDAADWALAVADYYGVDVEVTSVFRSWHEQAELRRRYEAGIHPYPVAKPGESAHNYGLAWDSVIRGRWAGNPDAQEWWNRVREYAGFQVPSNDEIHAALPEWWSYV